MQLVHCFIQNSVKKAMFISVCLLAAQFSYDERFDYGGWWCRSRNFKNISTAVG